MPFLLPMQPLEYPILKRSVRSELLEHGPIERRVVVEMFGQEPSQFPISIRSLSELMEHPMHKVRILRSSCHKLLPQDLIDQDPIHHRRISRHRMGTTGERRR